MNKERSLLIDCLRGVSAQIVLIGHVTALMCGWSEPQHPLNRLIRDGLALMGGSAHQAVMVFFVVSGYLVGGGAVLERIAGNRFSPLRYSIDRLARLWVVLIPGLSTGAILDRVSLIGGRANELVAARSGFFHEHFDLTSRTTVATFFCNIVFLQNLTCPQFGTNVSLWSLSCEAFFYILFPPLVLVFWPSTSFKSRLMSFLVVAAVFLFLRCFLNGTLYAIYGSMWVGGALVAFTWVRRPANGRSRAVAGAVLLVSGLLTYQGFKSTSSNGADFGVAIFAAGLLCLRQHLDAGLSLLGTGFRRGAEWLSNISFSAFVFHLPVAFLLVCYAPVEWRNLGKFSPPELLNVLLVAVVCNMTAVASYFLFERHYQAVRKLMTGLLRNRDFDPCSAEDCADGNAPKL